MGVDVMKMKRIRQRRRYQDSSTGNKRNDVGDSRKHVLLVLLEKFFHAAVIGPEIQFRITILLRKAKTRSPLRESEKCVICCEFVTGGSL